MGSPDPTPYATPGATPGGAPAAPPPPSRFLLGLALLFFIGGAALTLYAVLHRPDYVVLVAMDKAEVRWFQARMQKFGDDHHARIAVQAWSDRAELARLLARDRAQRHPRILLADVPFDRVVALADSGAILQLAHVKPLGKIDALLSTYLPFALAPARVAGRLYVVPSRLRTECLYYSKAHVADAYAHWQDARPQIEEWLKAANGRGLPSDFTFDANPALWDSYDVFVAAAYWATRPDRAGMKVARVAHVVAPEEALALDLASRADVMDAGNAELLDVDGERLGDALAWESMFFAHGLYHPAMLKERWTASAVLDAVAQGQVWMATLEPRDLLRLRGLPGQDPYVKDASDIGVALFPRGESLLLMRNDPARRGDPRAARTGYGWGVPASCPDPALAAQLLGDLTSEETTADLAQSLGWLPPRNGVEGDLDVLFRDKRSYEIALVGAHQLVAYGRSLPESPRWAEAQGALARLWEKTCVREQKTAPRDLAQAMTIDAPAAPAAH